MQDPNPKDRSLIDGLYGFKSWSLARGRKAGLSLRFAFCRLSIAQLAGSDLNYMETWSGHPSAWNSTLLGQPIRLHNYFTETFGHFGAIPPMMPSVLNPLSLVGLVYSLLLLLKSPH